jgi:hypothetical protein
MKGRQRYKWDALADTLAHNIVQDDKRVRARHRAAPGTGGG